MNCEDGKVYSVCVLQFSCFTISTTEYSQNINKQNVNIANETITDYSFLSRYHYNKLKNYLKRRYRIRHWIPRCIGTPGTSLLSGRDWSKDEFKSHFEGGVRLGVGTFNLMMSLLPTRITKLMEFVGFAGSKVS